MGQKILAHDHYEFGAEKGEILIHHNHAGT